MCKVICLSLKGGCYFGAAVHILDSLILIWLFIVELIKTSKLYWHGLLYDQYMTAHQVLIGMYVCAYLILGCIIFRGIEMESGKIIAVAAAVFLVVQFIAFIVSLVWWIPIPESQVPYTFQVYDIRVEFARILENARIARFIARILGTAAYLGTLGMFVRKIVHEGEIDIVIRP